MKTLTALPFLFLAVPVHAQFAEKCRTVQDCANTVAALTGQKFLFDGDMKGSVLGTPNLELTPENAERVFTLALHVNGFTRVPAGPKDTFWIARQRDARDSAIPLFDSDGNTPPKLPETWDQVTLRYRATNPETLDAMVRALRNFVTANARVIASDLSQSVWVTETAPNARKCYEMLKAMDVKPSAELRARWAEDRKERDSEARLRRAVEDALKNWTVVPTAKTN